MTKFSIDKYNEMLNSIRNEAINNTSNPDVDTDSITKILQELGIRKSNDIRYQLILWNDHVNNMMDVLVALFEVCKLSSERAMEVMLEAHEKGKAVVKSGPLDELQVMKTGLNDRNLEATIEEN
jgi:ATP-dependent Clp protease adaptor protein ClpS